MPRSLGLYFSDIKSAADYILRRTSRLDKSGYEQDEDLRFAVERQFTIIGEALSQMKQHYPSVMKELHETQKIIGFRNILVHQYSTVDNDDVWSLIQLKLPHLRNQAASLLERVERGEVS